MKELVTVRLKVEDVLYPYCDACRSEYLLAFSCTRRALCPSYAAKRGAIFGAFLGEEVTREVGHCFASAARR